MYRFNKNKSYYILPNEYGFLDCRYYFGYMIPFNDDGLIIISRGTGKVFISFQLKETEIKITEFINKLIKDEIIFEEELNER